MGNVKVLGVISARLNSSRLPAKQLLPLAGETMVGRLFQRLEKITLVDQWVLATTADDYNVPLVEWATAAQKSVFAYLGDVSDLVGRIDAIYRQYRPEFIVYVCGDSPLVEIDTMSGMIQLLQSSPEAEIVDYRPLPGRSQFIQGGFNVWKSAMWERIATGSHTADEREHVGYVTRRFPPAERVAYFEDDPLYSTLWHRTSIDTLSDYKFMQTIYQRWYANHPTEEVVPLRWVIELLKQEPELMEINRHVHQRGAGEPVLRVGFAISNRENCQLAIDCARSLQDYHAASVVMLGGGECNKAHEEWNLLPHQELHREMTLQKIHENEPFKLLVTDEENSSMTGVKMVQLQKLMQEDIQGVDWQRECAKWLMSQSEEEDSRSL